MKEENLNTLRANTSTLEEFHDEYMDLIYDPDERLFIDLERITWYEELAAVIESLGEILEDEINAEESK